MSRSEHARSPAATPEQLNNSTHGANLNYAAPTNQAAGRALAADAEKGASVAADAEKKAMVAVRKKQQTAGAIPRPNGSAQGQHKLENSKGHNGFVFMCSDVTYQECIGRCLFGLPGTRIPSLYTQFTLF